MLLLARAAGEAAHPELVELLGAERAAAVDELLLSRAVQWARGVAGSRVHVDEGHVDEGASARLGRAAQRVWDTAGEGPVLVAWPELPRWRPEHAGAALEDLAAGCDVSVGPVFDGGLYLVALRRPVPALFELPAEVWDSPDAMGHALGVVHQERLEAGLLRAERGLRRAADVRAALADPLLDPELRAILSG